jgi:hypothetical protein
MFHDTKSVAFLYSNKEIAENEWTFLKEDYTSPTGV